MIIFIITMTSTLDFYIFKVTAISLFVLLEVTTFNNPD